MTRNIDDIFQALVQGLALPPTPSDPRIDRVWEAYTQVVNMVGMRLCEEQFGAFTSAADEVRHHLERHLRVARMINGLELRVPDATSRAITTFGKYLEESDDVQELSEFLLLNAGIADRLGEYTGKHLGRAALPIKYSLGLVAKSAALMSESVNHELAPMTYRGL